MRSVRGVCATFFSPAAFGHTAGLTLSHGRAPLCDRVAGGRGNPDVARFGRRDRQCRRHGRQQPKLDGRVTSLLRYGRHPRQQPGKRRLFGQRLGHHQQSCRCDTGRPELRLRPTLQSKHRPVRAISGRFHDADLQQHNVLPAILDGTATRSEIDSSRRQPRSFLGAGGDDCHDESDQRARRSR